MATLGCDRKPPPEAVPEAATDAGDAADAGAGDDARRQRKPTRIEKALTHLDARTPAGAHDGPPPGGIYGAAAADAVLAPGAATKVDVAVPGAEPRRVLHPAAPTAGLSDETPASLSWVWQGKSVPPVDFELKFGLAAQPQRATTELRATVRKPKIAGLPAPLLKQFKPLTKQFAGATVTWSQAPNGAATPLIVGGAGGPTGEDAARFLAGMLSDALVAFPSSPVGQGALWMTTSREILLGFETITLRMVRLVSLASDSATLSVTTHRYATSDAMPLPGAPVGSKLVQFAVTSEATVGLNWNAAVPAGAQVATQLQLIMTVPDRPESGVPVRASANLTLGQEPPKD